MTVKICNKGYPL